MLLTEPLNRCQHAPLQRTDCDDLKGGSRMTYAHIRPIPWPLPPPSNHPPPPLSKPPPPPHLAGRQHRRRKYTCLVLVGWFLFGGFVSQQHANVSHFSGTDLLRQFYMLPHWDGSCRSNFLSYQVKAHWHWANQCWPYNARCIWDTLACCCDTKQIGRHATDQQTTSALRRIYLNNGTPCHRETGYKSKLAASLKSVWST